ncbi:NPCBM/NEW2 domain-containing protein [Gemmata sp. JC673]|uniref:NPCBM/NEW2 domain-containing protein n=1 Tax=Gemmata algarum TaxID=2975278 RepID=A0ABU5F8S2_9BACT|nr:NPCBM/NEW2 domain-containing protein [Gemmata algarum]MDY3563716.1 NPCBM/NEW2 domain-containing protein [Gemmata algarum]
MPRPYEREYSDLGKKRRRSNTFHLPAGIPAWLPAVIWLGGAVLPLAFLLIAAVASGTRPVLMPLAIATGLLSFTAGWVWLMIVAASDGFGTLLMFMFIPLYGLYYITNNIEQTVRPLSLYILGIVVVAAAGFVPGPPPKPLPPPEQVQTAPRNGPAPADPPGVKPPEPKPAPKKGPPPTVVVPKPPFDVDPKAKDAGPKAYLASLTPFDYQAGPWKLGVGVRGDDLKTPIRVKSQEYRYGLSTHPPGRGACRVSFVPGREFKRFKGWVGIGDSVGKLHAPVVFAVYGDGRQLWESAGVGAPGDTAGFDIDVTDVKVLTLEARMQSGFNHLAHASWLDPWLER